MRSARVHSGSTSLAATLALWALVAAARAQTGVDDSHIDENGDRRISVIVETCIDGAGGIKSVHLVRSSTHAEVDEAALKVAWNTRYSPKANSTPDDGGCVKFKVQFVLKNGKVTPAPPAGAADPAVDK